MKKSAVFFALVFFCFFCIVDTVFAQRGRSNEIRLASSLPRNSDWGRALDRLAADWTRVLNNDVRILHQQEGGEAKMLQSLSSNNIHAALFLSSGLAEICPATFTLCTPFLIQGDAELDLVLKETLPILESQVDPNFVIIAWAKGGWVNVFSIEPVIVPDDLRRQKIASSPEFKDLNFTFRNMGFQMVETEMTDLVNKLNGRLVNATYLIPAVIPPMGLHKNLYNMLDLSIAPVMGAIVMNRVTWNRIAADRQRELLRITQRVASDFNVITPRINADAVTLMSREGLKVNRPNQAQEELWQNEFQRALPSLMGTAFDRNLYQQINSILERARSGQ
jgi:TRAP-type C4-dicarboxylate transport system substrate-binding protein